MLPFRTIQYKLIRRLPKRLRAWNVYVTMDFNGIESLKQYLLHLDSHFYQIKILKLSDVKSKLVYTKISLKALLKVKRSISSRLFSAERANFEVAYKRNVTYIQKIKLKKMTPLEHGRETSSEYGNKKSIPLEVAYVDIYKDAPKLDAEYMVLLKPKRLSRVRYSRYKAWTNGYGLIQDPL